MAAPGQFFATADSSDDKRSGAAGSPGAETTSEAREDPLERATISTRPATEEEVLRVTVKSYSDAFLSGDAPYAFAGLTPRCQREIGRTVFFDVVEQAKTLYGNALPFETYTADIDQFSARVTYTFAVSALDQRDEPWVNSDGFWRNDDC